jgi:hypothetical protein
MNKKVLLLLILVVLAVAFYQLQADVIPTNVWADYYGSVTVNGQPAAVGTVVDAYDPQGVHCGTFAVDSAGDYGFLHVYGDDDTSLAVDHGAELGDSITFRVNGKTATRTVVSGGLTWTSSTQNNVDLAATQTVAFTAVTLPSAKAAVPGDTVGFDVGIRNDGDGIDLYGVHSTVRVSAQTIDQPGFSQANPGDTVNVHFDVALDLLGGGADTVYTITYTIYSQVDTTVTYTDSVLLFKSITDVGDNGWANLPDKFNLFQNYPNPFNPTTTIAFNLPSRSVVNLEVINMLGQVVDARSLGNLPAGLHEIEYDASRLASGVYFYRLITDNHSLSRKMILLK